MFLLAWYDNEVWFIFQAFKEVFIFNFVTPHIPHWYSGITNINFEQPFYKQLY